MLCLNITCMHWLEDDCTRSYEEGLVPQYMCVDRDNSCIMCKQYAECRGGLFVDRLEDISEEK